MTSTTGKTHYKTVLAGGKHWSFRLRKGLTLTLEDLGENANVAMLLYNAENLLERYNAPDTLKCQHTFHLTQGHCLYSDMGHVLAAIISDSAGGHETICGNSNATQVADAFGNRDYQNHRNQWYQNGHDAFLVELAKYGLTRRDMPANINWFNKCDIQSDGAIALATPASEPGRAVTLRIEMDCIVMLHTCPHPLAAKGVYPQSAVALTLADAAPMAADDPCLNSCDENRRGYENNRLYHLGLSA